MIQFLVVPGVVFAGVICFITPEDLAARKFGNRVLTIEAY